MSVYVAEPAPNVPLASSVQFVIGTREEPRLRLGALRVRRQLYELDTRQMQFDIEEVAQFCSSRLGRELPPAELQQLLAKTEGWPAALELAALALHDAVDPADFIAQFAGTDSSVVDYLGEDWAAYPPRYNPKTPAGEKARRRLIDLAWLVHYGEDEDFRLHGRRRLKSHSTRLGKLGEKIGPVAKNNRHHASVRVGGVGGELDGGREHKGGAVRRCGETHRWRCIDDQVHHG